MYGDPAGTPPAELPPPPPPPTEDPPRTYDGPPVERVGISQFRSVPVAAEEQRSIPIATTIEEDRQEVDRPTTIDEDRQEVDRLTSINLQNEDDMDKIPAMSEEEKYQMGVFQALLGLLLASLVEMIQAIKVCSDADECEGTEAFAVALGTVSSLCCFGIIVANRCIKRSRKSFVYSKKIDENLLPYVSIFLTIWWVVGVVICTFDEPFEATGNGYFACWFALLASLYFCQITISKFGAIIMKCKNDVGNPQQRAMVVIALLSFMEAYACILQLDEYNSVSEILDAEKSSDQEYWGLSCGVISGTFVIITLIIEKRVRRLKGQPGILSYFLLPWWLFGAGVVTFDQPFTMTGNGYFCAWGAFCMSAYLLYLTRTEQKGSVLKGLSNVDSFNPTLR